MELMWCLVASHIARCHLSRSLGTLRAEVMWRWAEGSPVAPSEHVLLFDLVEVRVQVRGVLQVGLSQGQQEPWWCLGTECRP